MIAAQLADRTATCTDDVRAAEEAGIHDASVPISNADSVIAGLRLQFRRCYQEGLKADRTMHGNVVITAHVGPDGLVDSSRASSHDGLSSAVESCVAEVISHATFSAPGGCGSLLQVPVRFVSSDK